MSSSDDRAAADVAALIADATRVLSPPLTPELRMRGADDCVAIWSATEAALDALRLPPPFWAFAWPGGQALARFLLDRPDAARDRRVLAIAAGAGLEAIAAAIVGARSVVANDVDPIAVAAAEMNAALNGVRLEGRVGDLLARAPDPAFDLILVGDAFYEAAFTARLTPWLSAAAQGGAEVLIGDPTRGYPPRAGFETLAVYAVPTPAELEDVDHRDTRVLRATAALR